MPPIPFLKSEEKLTFLRTHHMIEADPNDENEFAWLESINFHYMLGYARNYRALVDRELIRGAKRLSQIRSIIDSETKLSTFMMPWLRKAELNLRALTIKHFCEKQAHGEGYLELSNWQSNTEGDRERLRSRILDSIHRHSEPYVQKGGVVIRLW